MATSFFLGTIPFWQFFDNQTKATNGAYFFTRRSAAPSEDKAVYQDPGAAIPYTNPIAVGPKGIPPIYWADDEPYYIFLAKNQDGSGKIWSVDHYTPPEASGPTPVTQFFNFDNQVRNSNFEYIIASTFSGLTNIRKQLAYQQWFFNKSINTGTDEVQMLAFPLGQTDVTEGSPRRYMRMKCTDPGTGQTSKIVSYVFNKVNQFQNETISVAFWGRSASSTTVDLRYEQNFGTGGSPSTHVSASLITAVMTTSWQKFTVQNVPILSIAGKSLGSNNDDAFFLYFNLPVDASYEIDFTNMQLNVGTKIYPYEYKTYDRTGFETRASYVPLPQQDAATDIYDCVIRASTDIEANYTLQPVPHVGSILIWPTDVLPYGFLFCFGQTLSTTTYARLFAVIGHIYGGSGGSFKVPDLRGEFIRGVDGTAGRDPDSGTRTNRGDGSVGNIVGTKQPYQVQSHTHTYKEAKTSVGRGPGDQNVWDDESTTEPSGPFGGNETRPINIYMNFIIKY